MRDGPEHRQGAQQVDHRTRQGAQHRRPADVALRVTDPARRHRGRLDPQVAEQRDRPGGEIACHDDPPEALNSPKFARLMKNSPIATRTAAGTNFSTVVTTWKAAMLRSPARLTTAGSHSPTSAITTDRDAVVGVPEDLDVADPGHHDRGVAAHAVIQ